MKKEIQLIKLYCAVCHIYNTITARDCQRLSNNFCPKFSDEECITIYLWGIANQKFEVKASYDFIKEYWEGWFPDLPSYQNYNRRICNLHDIFRQISSYLITKSDIDPSIIDYLHDSMPVIVANEKRSGSAKTAGEICNKGYCASKKMYYYGVKIHAIAQKQYTALPNLFAPPAGGQVLGLLRRLSLTSPPRKKILISPALPAGRSGILTFSETKRS
jgi:hypothetical protein